MIEPLKPEVVARVLAIGAAGIAAAIAVVSFLPKLEELASKRIPSKIAVASELQKEIEKVRVAGKYFQVSIVLFASSDCIMLVYIGLSGIYVPLIPQVLVAIASCLGPLLLAGGTVTFGYAVLRWARFYLFLLKQTVA